MKRNLSNIRHVLLDIEGTICPIAFVKDTLFPYALKALPDIARSKWHDPEFEKYKSAFPNECQETAEKLIEHVKDLTERNIKIAYFKDLQGYLWEDGYKCGAYSSPFFDDVAPALRRWKDAGVGTSIYSSGSVFAQKLLFGHVKGSATDSSEAIVDLRPMIEDWFDTTNAGSKMEEKSYEKICRALEVPPVGVLFLSDNMKELNAAQEAQLKVALVLREGNEEVSDDDRRKHEVLKTFAELDLGHGEMHSEKTQVSLKRSIEDSKHDVSENQDSTKDVNDDARVEIDVPKVEKKPLSPRKKLKTSHAKESTEQASPQRRSQRLRNPKGST